MRFQYDDGGRKAANFKGQTGDCVVRAVAIAAQLPYRDVYYDLFQLNRKEVQAAVTSFALKGLKNSARYVRRSATPRNGVHRKVFNAYLRSLGWTWTPTMHIGSGCRVHLVESELPSGRLIVRLSRHLTTVIDGVLHDTYDCSRDGRRCVYGYYSKERTA